MPVTRSVRVFVALLVLCVPAYLTGIFRASDFPRPGAGMNGNLVRNAYRGPGYIDVSVSRSKKFRSNEKWAGEFRLDAFNALNRVNLENPSPDLSNPNFGRSTSQLTRVRSSRACA